jgi:hypothetical protein
MTAPAFDPTDTATVAPDVRHSAFTAAMVAFERILDDRGRTIVTVDRKARDPIA